MKCQDIMKKSVECLDPQDTVNVAATRMRDANIGFMPICDKNKKVLGTLTDRDIVIRLVAEKHAPDTPVRTIMTEEVVACRPSDDLEKAEDLMGSNHKSRILCLNDDGTLAGVISLSDVVQADQSQRAVQTLREVSMREVHA